MHAQNYIERGNMRRQQLVGSGSVRKAHHVDIKVVVGERHQLERLVEHVKSPSITVRVRVGVALARIVVLLLAVVQLGSADAAVVTCEKGLKQLVSCAPHRIAEDLHALDRLSEGGGAAAGLHTGCVTGTTGGARGKGGRDGVGRRAMVGVRHVSTHMTSHINQGLEAEAPSLRCTILCAARPIYGQPPRARWE